MLTSSVEVRVVAKVKIKVVGSWSPWQDEARLGRLTRAEGAAESVLIRFLPDLSSDPERVRTLREHGKVLARLRHANVLRLLHVSMVGPQAVVVHEGFEGASMATALAGQRESGQQLPVRVVIETAAGVGAALSAAGQVAGTAGDGGLSVFHPGPSPSEVLIDATGTVKVAGFAVKGPGVATIDAAPGYLPPDGVDAPNAATYGLGALLVELLAGERPSVGSLDPNRHEATVRRSLIRILARPGEAAPDGVVNLVRQCLARESSARPSIDEAVRHLEEFALDMATIGVDGWAASNLPGFLGEHRFDDPQLPLMPDTDSAVRERPANRGRGSDPRYLAGAAPPLAAIPTSEEEVIGDGRLAGVEPSPPPVRGNVLPSAMDDGQLPISTVPLGPVDDDYEEAATTVLPDAERRLAAMRADAAMSIGNQGSADDDALIGLLAQETAEAARTGSADDVHQAGGISVGRDTDQALGRVGVMVDHQPTDDGAGMSISPARDATEEEQPVEEVYVARSHRAAGLGIGVVIGLFLLAVVVVGTGVVVWRIARVRPEALPVVETVAPVEPPAPTAPPAEALPADGEPATAEEGAAEEGAAEEGAAEEGAAEEGAAEEGAAEEGAAEEGAAEEGAAEESPAATDAAGNDAAAPDSVKQPVEPAPADGSAPGTAKEAAPAAGGAGSAGSTSSSAKGGSASTARTSGGSTASGSASTKPGTKPPTTTRTKPPPTTSTKPPTTSSAGSSKSSEEVVARITPTETSGGSSTTPPASAGAGSSSTGTPAPGAASVGTNVTGGAGSGGGSTTATPVASDSFQVEFKSADPSVTALEVRCHQGSGQGASPVVIPDAGRGPCKVTGKRGDERLVAMVSLTSARTFTCFEGGARSCK